MTDQAGKPPLSDPMAEALAEDAANAAAQAAQEAQEAQTAVEATPVAETTAETADAAPTAEETVKPDEPAAKPRKTPEQKLQDRVGFLTKQKAEQERAAVSAREEAAQAKAEAAALRQLLEAQGKDPSEAVPVKPAATPDGARTYTQEELRAEASRIAAQDAFNHRANETYEAGKEKFGDWDARLENLRSMGLMTEAMVDAAMASDAPTDILHHLGGDLDEAERLATLPPVRLGVELAKLASKFTTPKQTAISRAPAPHTPVNGAVTPTVDLAKLADGNDMGAYVAARKAAGDPWATGRSRR